MTRIIPTVFALPHRRFSPCSNRHVHCRENTLGHFIEKQLSPFPPPSSARQELRLKWSADAMLQRGDCCRTQCVTATLCVRLHHSFSTSQINQTLFGRGRRSPNFHLLLSYRSRAEEWAEKLAEGCSFNLSWPPNPPQANQPLLTLHTHSQHA